MGQKFEELLKKPWTDDLTSGAAGSPKEVPNSLELSQSMREKRLTEESETYDCDSQLTAEIRKF